MSGFIRYWLLVVAISISIATATTYAQISAEQTLYIGQQLIDSEDYALAVQYLGKTIQAKPYLAEPYYLRALAKMMLGDYAGAQADCSSAIDRNPYIRDQYRVRGLCFMLAGRYSQALDDFNRGLELMSNDRNILYYRALCLNELDKHTESHKNFVHLQRLYPDFIPAYTSYAASLLAQKDTIEALNILNSAPGKGKNSAGPTLMRAQLALEQRRWDDALLELNSALKLMPHNDAIYVNRGVALYHSGNLRGAKADFNAALDINPDNGVAFSNLSGAAPRLCALPQIRYGLIPDSSSHKANKTEASPCDMFALTYTHPYDELHPLAYPYPELAATNVAAHLPSPLYLSHTAGATPDPEQAVALFAFAEEPLTQNNAEQLLGRAVAYAMLKNYEAALSDLNKVIELRPDLTAALLERAFVLSEMANNFRQNTRHKDRDARLTAEAQAGDALSKALADIDRLVALDPEMPYAIYNKGVLETMAGNLAEAIKCYDTAIQLNPKFAQAYLNRGLLYARQGLPDKAVSDWSRAGELGLPRAYSLIRSAGHPKAEQ